jgi:hypothetical protein
MLRFQEEILWKGQWRPTDGHLVNIKKALDAGIKYGGSAPGSIIRGERGLEFYFGNDAHKVLKYFVANGMPSIGGPIKYQGRVIVDTGDLKVLANNLNKMKFMPSDDFIQWVNSD